MEVGLHNTLASNNMSAIQVTGAGIHNPVDTDKRNLGTDKRNLGTDKRSLGTAKHPVDMGRRPAGTGKRLVGMSSTGSREHLTETMRLQEGARMG